MAASVIVCEDADVELAVTFSTWRQPDVLSRTGFRGDRFSWVSGLLRKQHKRQQLPAARIRIPQRSCGGVGGDFPYMLKGGGFAAAAPTAGGRCAPVLAGSDASEIRDQALSGSLRPTRHSDRDARASQARLDRHRGGRARQLGPSAAGLSTSTVDARRRGDGTGHPGREECGHGARASSASSSPEALAAAADATNLRPRRPRSLARDRRSSPPTANASRWPPGASPCVSQVSAASVTCPPSAPERIRTSDLRFRRRSP
jgi:hypothetical protein